MFIEMYIYGYKYCSKDSDGKIRNNNYGIAIFYPNMDKYYISENKLKYIKK